MKLISPRCVNKKIPCDLLLLGEAPGSEEVQQGRAFVGPAGKLLDDVLHIWQGEIPGLSLVIDNAYPADDRVNIKPKKAELLPYREYLLASIEQHKPKIIVALGATALTALGIGDTKPTKQCGMERKIGLDWFAVKPQVQVDQKSQRALEQIPVIVCVHPSFVLRSGGQALHYFRQAFATIKKLLTDQGDEKVERIDSPRDWSKALKSMYKSLCAVDLETDGLNPRRNGILCGSASDGERTVWTPLHHSENKQKAIVIRSKQVALMDFWSRGPRIAQNVKHELKWFRASGAKDPAVLYDTMLEAYLLNMHEPHGLDHLAVKYCKAPPWWTRLPQGGLFSSTPLNVLGPYNGLDSLWTHRLHLRLKELLDEISLDLSTMCQRIIIPLAKLLPTMETRGLHCDRNLLEGVVRKLGRFHKERMTRLEKIFPDVNFRSNPQMTELLFEKLKLPIIRRTKKNNPSADANTLEELSKQEPSLIPLAECRQIANVQSKMETWLEALDRNDLLHTDYTLGYVVTGRLSSTKPNLQNIDRPPAKDDPAAKPWHGLQRKALTSRYKNGWIIQLDYAQHELRIYTAETGDSLFSKAFEEKTDLHQVTADAMDFPRSTAKNINFSILYVITPEGLFAKYGITRDEGVTAIAKWHEVHPELKRFYVKVCHDFIKNGCVTTMFGFRYVPENVEQTKREAKQFIASIERGDQEFYYRASHEIRQLINVMIQGPAVFCTYIAMPFVEKMCSGFKGKEKPLMVHQIHDSIVIDSPDGIQEEVAKRAIEVMENIDLKPHLVRKLKQDIPLKAEAKISRTL